MLAKEPDVSLEIPAAKRASSALVVRDHADELRSGLLGTLVVPIDIKPGNKQNSTNPGSKGVIAVAILSTESFDATTVDPHTVLFGPSREEDEGFDYCGVADPEGNQVWAVDQA